MWRSLTQKTSCDSEDMIHNNYELEKTNIVVGGA